MNKQIVYIKAKNTDLAENTYGIVKPSDKSFVEFVAKTKAYVFAPEELKQLISDTFDAGWDGKGEFWLDKKREEYIENLLNKEK